MLHKTTRWNLTAPAAGIIIAILILLFQAANPKAAIVDFATGSFTSAYYFGTVLNTAVLFITAGLGAALALKSGFLNLGGEGQIYAGGFTAAIVLDRMKQFPAVSGLAAALIAAAAAAALMAFVPALLKQFKNADVLLTSFLVSAATIPLIDALIAGKFRDVSG
ncbi:MAG: ABC transporter permease, partial [Treponema sp.]|nr:ABC transporter permease [Treponema sp.]